MGQGGGVKLFGISPPAALSNSAIVAQRDLLPGVRPDRCPPAILLDSRREIARARRWAAARDIANLFFLGAVDYVFLYWPSSHITLLDREQSLLVVAATNGVVLTHMMLSRVFPKWSAKRIATTWCLAERARFFAQQRGEPVGQERRSSTFR